jgi:hypothetical protein
MTAIAPDLEIGFRARTDGSVVLRCVRRDGSITWQVQSGPRAMFFPLHDLTHYAIETTLAARDGFFGLVAAGWDIADTDGKGARGRLPPEAALVEHLVGLMTQERIGGSAPLSAPDASALLDPLVRTGELPAFRLDDGALARARTERERLHDAWARCPADAPLSLSFRRPPVSGLLSLADAPLTHHAGSS